MVGINEPQLTQLYDTKTEVNKWQLNLLTHALRSLNGFLRLCSLYIKTLD